MGSRRGVKYCQNCGAMHDLNFPNTCSVCGQPIRTEEQRKRDKSKIVMQCIARRKVPYQEKYDELAKLQKGLTSLTEAEWQKAVKHFGGCAMCSSLEVAARVMLVNVKDGGRYNRGNIFPACEACATVARRIAKGETNWVDKQSVRRVKNDKEALQRLDAVLEYLKAEAQHD